LCPKGGSQAGALARFRQGRALVSHGSGGRRIRNLLHLRPRPVFLLSALAADRAALRRLSGRGIRISYKSLLPRCTCAESAGPAGLARMVIFGAISDMAHKRIGAQRWTTGYMPRPPWPNLSTIYS